MEETRLLDRAVEVRPETNGNGHFPQAVTGAAGVFCESIALRTSTAPDFVDLTDRVEDILERQTTGEPQIQHMPHIGRGADRPKHHLGIRLRGDDIWSDTAADQSDRVVRRAQIRITRPCHRTKFDERVDELLDRRLAQFRTTRMCGTS